MLYCNMYTKGTSLPSYAENEVLMDISTMLNEVNTSTLRMIMVEFSKFFGSVLPKNMTRKNIIQTILSKKVFVENGLCEFIRSIIEKGLIIYDEA